MMTSFSSCDLHKYPKETANPDGSITYDFKYFNKSNIILPKSQSKGQILSVIIKNDDGDMIIFDGGRTEDADYLTDLIVENGGRVKAWFLTHIHDDHIGALFEILKRKEYKFFVDNIYYSFADFDWYYKKIGVDAGALKVFEESIHDYNENAILNRLFDYTISVNTTLNKGDNFNFNDLSVKCLNSLYKLNQDPINNTSIVYKVYIEGKTVIVYGDLGYAGGEKLIKGSTDDDLKADIIVLAHHGQNAIGKEVYEKASPETAIWCTTHDIYDNINGKYKTDETKEWLSDIGVKYHITTIDNTCIIK